MAMENTAPDPALKQSILTLVRRFGTHEAVHGLVRRMARDLGVSRACIRHSLQTLLAEGAVMFTSRLGSSFIEPSFRGPVRLTRRIWIAQPGQSPRIGPDEVVISIASGDAFGDGRHPTTRLALETRLIRMGLI